MISLCFISVSCNETGITKCTLLPSIMSMLKQHFVHSLLHRVWFNGYEVRWSLELPNNQASTNQNLKNLDLSLQFQLCATAFLHGNGNAFLTFGLQKIHCIELLYSIILNIFIKFLYNILTDKQFKKQYNFQLHSCFVSYFPNLGLTYAVANVWSLANFVFRLLSIISARRKLSPRIVKSVFKTAKYLLWSFSWEIVNV